MVQETLTREVDNWLNVARVQYPDRNIPPLRVQLNNRLTRVAGRYWREKRLIEFSSAIIQDNGLDRFLEDGIVQHEVAHHIVRSIWGDAPKSHGNEFYFVMRRVLMCSPENSKRCHDLITRKRNTTTYKYACPKCGKEFDLSAIRHSKIRNGTSYIHCRDAMPIQRKYS